MARSRSVYLNPSVAKEVKRALRKLGVPFTSETVRSKKKRRNPKRRSKKKSSRRRRK